MRSRAVACDSGAHPLARFALAHETDWPRDLAAVIERGTFDPPPWNVVLGPTRERGGPSGLVSISGRVVAQWGDVERADMCFSVTKSYLAVLAGVALDDGLIGAMDDPVRLVCEDELLETPQNRDVTWLQLLQQTSELAAELWGIPDAVDRNRQLSPQEDPGRFNQPHRLQPPGTYWDYNDVRVNVLCRCLTRLFGKPLSAVLGERLLGPIGAAPGWDWWGLEGGVIEIGGRAVTCVVGGGHWGGGLVTSACHDARLGRLIAQRGVWKGRRVVSQGWLERMLSPCPLNPVYGALWWLNTGCALHRAASEESVFAFGVGMNAIWVDPTRDLVAVARWMRREAFDEFVALVMGTLDG